MFLKWENEVIGRINKETHEVELINGSLNKTVDKLFHGKDKLLAHEWRAFLEDRIVSRDRRDIEKILFHCGLSFYDPFKIAEKTRADYC